LVLHSIIIQVSTAPIDREDYYDSEMYTGDNSVSQFADYLSDMTEDEMLSNIRWLGEKNGIYTNPNNRTLMITGKREYFKDSYEKFMHALEMIRHMTYGEFITNSPKRAVYDISYYFDKASGVYVDSDKYDLIPFDEFVRLSDEGIPYYIGAVIGYHF
jgi:hypothetical protein